MNINKKSQKEFLDKLEILMVRFAKDNPNIESKIFFAEVNEIFLNIIFGYFEKIKAEDQFVNAMMASISNFAQDRIPDIVREKLENVERI
jgi:hypothetical protein